MKGKSTYIFLLIFSIILVGISNAGDPPHNEASGIDCSDCHGQSLLDNQSPFYTDNNSDTAYNAVCTGVCHTDEVVGYDTGNVYHGSIAPLVLSHTIGATVIKCTVCHHNHDQDQIYVGKNEKNKFFLATGTLDTGAPTPLNYNSGTNRTTITYDTLTPTDGSSLWADLTFLAKKTGDGRGAMLVPNHTSRQRWPVYLIKSIDTGAKTIAVKGKVTAASNLGIFYGQVVRRTINYEPVAGMPKSVKFYDKSGENSFAHNNSPGGDDTSPNSICQICHTQTNHWRNDGTLSAVGVHAGMDDGVNCAICHSHAEGFKASCNACHGFAPGALVSNPGPTGSTTAGVHTEHTVNQGYGCEICHNGSVGSGPTHKNGDLKVTLGFVPPNGIPQGGSYDGQATVQYDATVTSPVTSVSNTGTKTCSSLYCHGSFAGSGLNATPVWDNPATGDCDTCHESGGGAHSDHISIHGFDCSLCHYDTADGTSLATDTTTHVNYATDWRFDPTDIRTSGAVYNSSSSGLKSPPSTTYSSCDTLYCHSSVQGKVDPTSESPVYQNPSWSATLTGCDDCHKAGAHRDPPFMDTGSHETHVQYRFTQPGNCQACHYIDKGGGDLCGACHSPHGFLMSRTGNHVDGNIDVDFLTTIAGETAVYNGDDVPATAFDTCDNIYCHSDGKSAGNADMFPVENTTPNWDGQNPDPQDDGNSCNNCHPYPPVNDNHMSHVTIRGYTCQMCHYTTTQDSTTINDKTLHVNGVFDLSPSGLTPLSNPVNFTYTAMPIENGQGGQCSSNTCHQDSGFGQVNRWLHSYISSSFGYTETCSPDGSTSIVNATVTSSGGSGTYECQFDWGDGNIDDWGACARSHDYGVLDTFTVTWRARDDQGVPMNTPNPGLETINVCNDLPMVDFEVADGGCGVNQGRYDVVLYDLSTDGDYNTANHSGSGEIKINWAGAGTNLVNGITQGVVNLTDIDPGTADPNTMRRNRFVYNTSGDYDIFIAVKDNGNDWVCSDKMTYAVDNTSVTWTGSTTAVSEAECDALIASNANYPSPGEINYQFRITTENWYKVQDILGYGIADGKLVANTNGIDPIITNNCGVDFYGSHNRKVYIRMSTTCGTLGQLFWITDIDPIWDEEKSKSFALTSNGTWQDYILDLTGDPDWDGQRITQLRFDPTNPPDSNECVVKIEYIQAHSP